MDKKTIIIRIQNEGVSFNVDNKVPIKNTNIPIHSLKFRSNEEIYWLVELEKYSNTDKCLTIKVVDYKPTDVSTFKYQLPKNEIEKIVFADKFDWDYLEPLLTSYTKSNLSSLIINLDKREQERMKGSRSLGFSNSLGRNSQFQSIPTGHEYPIVSRTIKETFSVNFQDSKIEAGCISFKRKLSEFGIQINFVVANSNLLPEFDNIKSWFSKKLKRKRFIVNAEIKISNGLIAEVNASSKDIDLITPEMIDSIKYISTISIAKKSNSNEKSLLSINEIFSESLDDGSTGNIFNLTDEQILALLIQKKGIRNKKQLEYLSGSKQSIRQKMRYTLHPQFGFLFFVEGLRHNHFVWELLDSHATYLWSMEIINSNVVDQFRRMEVIINKIKKDGRENYKNAYKNLKHDSALLFSVTQHKDASTASTDDFNFWKQKVNEVIK